MKRLSVVQTFLAFVFLLSFTNGYAAEQFGKHLNLDEDMLAIQGYDPTSYHSGKVTSGSKQHQLKHNGAVYYFSSEENKKKFQSDPDKYTPAYGGWCAWAMLDGEKVRINPKSYKIVEGKTYLFYDFYFTDTLKKWNNLAKDTSETSLIEQANRIWMDLTTK